MKGDVLAVFKIRGTVFSGDPVATTLGNTERLVQIKLRIAQEAGVLEHFHPG